MDKVSVIVPTYNRFKFLLNTIKYIKDQTYQNIEIIVVNDCSIEKEYYDYNWKDNGIIIIHLPENTKNKFGYVCSNFVRNKGIEISTGKYIAFCDDDDIWFPNKIEMQIKAMKNTGCKMSSTDGLCGNGIYNSLCCYPKYNSEYYYDTLKNIYKNKGSNMLNNGFPEKWTLDFLRIHNSVIISSVFVDKDILNKINNMPCVKNGGEDYLCWLMILKHTNSVYVKDVCFYYDSLHGYGQNY